MHNIIFLTYDYKIKIINDPFITKLKYKKNNIINKSIFNIVDDSTKSELKYHLTSYEKFVHALNINYKDRMGSIINTITSISKNSTNIKLYIKINNHELSTNIIKSMYKLLNSYVKKIGKNDWHNLRKIMLEEIVKVSNSDYGYLTRTYKKNNISGQKLVTISKNIVRDSLPDFLKKYNDKNEFIFYDSHGYHNIVSKSERPYINNNIKNDPHSLGKRTFHPKNNRLKTFMNYPLIYQNKVIGSIGLANRLSGYNNKLIKRMRPIFNTIIDIEISHENNLKLKKDHKKKIQQAELDAAIQAKSMFLANMSHEIRTPMNGIYGTLSILKNTKLNQMQKDTIEVCMRSADSLLSILDDILLFSKADVGAIKLEQISFNLNDVVEDIMQVMNANLNNSAKVDLVHCIKPDVPLQLIGDPGRLRQILFNLLSNAIKFTSIGEIALEISLKNKNPLIIQYEVSDTGIGMSNNQITKLFKPFTQADSSTTRKYGGTGLGLAICKHLIKQYNGTISVQSRINRGSSFTFTTQFKMDKEKTNKIPYDLTLKNLQMLKNLKIITIDDNDVNCLAMEYLFGSLCQKITTTRSGIRGIEEIKLAILRNEPYDILLLDYHMPGLDGIRVARILKQEDIDIKILMLSSVSDKSNTIKQEPNIRAIVHKPIRKKLLLSLICRSLIDGDIISEDMDHINLDKNEFNGVKCLIVEDNKINRKVMSNMLELLGTETDQAQNGLEAMEKIKNNHYHIVLMDIHMPIMDGLEATKIIKKNHNIPIIALTADISPTIEDRCVIAGMDGYLTKPIPLSKLKDYINKYVNCKKVIENKQIKILVADDSETNRAIIKSYLHSKNYIIDDVVNGEEAINQIKLGKKYNIVLMDIHMPIMDGIEATKEILKLTSIPIIGFTAENDQKKIREYKNEGMKDIIIKPIKQRELEYYIQKYTTIDEVKILDKDMLNEIGDHELQQIILHELLDDTNNKIVQIDQYLTTSKHQDIQQIAHSIKGSAGQVGAERLSQTASKLELMSQKRDSLGEKELLFELKQEIVLLEKKININV